MAVDTIARGMAASAQEGGTTNYNDLSNKPSINGVTLSGSLTTSSLAISYADLTHKPVFIAVYGSTEYEDIEDALTDGKIVILDYNNVPYLYHSAPSGYYYFARVIDMTFSIISVSSSDVWAVETATTIAPINYDDIVGVVEIDDTTTTLGDIATILSSVNTAGNHVLFDVSALGAQMYLCTIFIDTSAAVYKIFDLVSGRIAEGTYASSTLLTMAIALADTVATQSQIDYLQDEINELGGKSAIDDWDTLGDLILSGDSTNYIDPGDTIDVNWIATVLGTTTNGLTVSCSNIDTFANEIGEAEASTYLFVYDGSDWTYEGNTVDLTDYALTVTGTPATGEVMTIVTTVTATEFTFTSYDTVDPVDSNVTHNWLLEQTYAPNTKVYDIYESLFCVQAGKTIPAGSYYLPMYSYRSGNTFNVCFTLSAALGSTVKVQAKSNGFNASVTIPNASGTSITGVYTPSTLSPLLYGTTTSAGSTITPTYLSTTDAESGGYTLLTDLNTDASDPVFVAGDFDCAALGDNTWPYSNVHEYLNDDTQGDNWSPTHDNDIASSYNRGDGWLFGIDPRVKTLIQTAEVKWTAGYGNPSDFTQGTTYTSNDDVFLLSMKEMSYNLNTAEGTMTELYGEYTSNTLTNDAVQARAKYNKAGGTLNSYRWSRSARVGSAFYSWYVAASGGCGNRDAISAPFVAPAFIIGKSAS